MKNPEQINHKIKELESHIRQLQELTGVKGHHDLLEKHKNAVVLLQQKIDLLKWVLNNDELSVNDEMLNSKIVVLIKYKEWVDSNLIHFDGEYVEFGKVVEVQNITELNNISKTITDIKILS